MAEQAWNVLIINPPADADFDYENRELSQLGVKVQPIFADDDDQLLELAADADVLVPAGYSLSARVIEGLRRCRLIPALDLGGDRVDLAAATARGILVTDPAEVLVEEIADHAWMLLLLVARRGLWLDDAVSDGRWQEAHDALIPDITMPMPRVSWRTLGVIGFGEVGQAIARRGQGFGMNCVVYDPGQIDDEVFANQRVEKVSLASLCRRADFICCHLPLTPETEHLVGKARFAAMKDGAIFVNIGHGKTVDEAALVAALQNQTIAGAGLDALEHEPPDPENPLLKLPNVAITPHVAAASAASYVGRHRLVGRQIADALQGRVPSGVVNLEALESWPYHAENEPA